MAEEIKQAYREAMRAYALCASRPYREDVPRLLDALDAAEAERDVLRRHFDAASPEHNLVALLDLYAERQADAEKRAEEAEAAIARLQPLVDAARAVHDRFAGRLDNIDFTAPLLRLGADGRLIITLFDRAREVLAEEVRRG